MLLLTSEGPHTVNAIIIQNRWLEIISHSEETGEPESQCFLTIYYGHEVF